MGKLQLGRMQKSSLLVRSLRLPMRFSSSVPPLTIERLSGGDSGIVVFRMNNPATKNAISKAFLTQLKDGLQQMKFDKNTRVVILKSDVPGAFCTGADLKERKTMPVDDVPKFVDSLRSAFSDLERLPQPVIAAIDGYALGGGLEMALSCDIRIASTKSKVGLTETKLAIIPGAGGTQRLTRVIGVARAKELIYTGKLISGEEAASIGLVNHCVEDSFERALHIARDIIPRGPVAVRLAKLAIDLGTQVDQTSGLVVEQQCYAQIVPTKDRIEGLTAFAEKRPPVYKGE